MKAVTLAQTYRIRYPYQDHRMSEIYKASIPFVIIDIGAMAIIMIFPDISLFLFSIAKR